MCKPCILNSTKKVGWFSERSLTYQANRPRVSVIGLRAYLNGSGGLVRCLGHHSLYKKDPLK